MVGTLTLATGCTPEPPPVSEQVQKYYDEQMVSRPTATAAKVVSYSAYGDSLSNGDSPDFAAGKFGSLSWSSYLGEGISFAGGWAQGGVRTETMLENAKPVEAQALVLMVGANDYVQDIPFDQTAANIRGIVQKTGVSRVILSSIPPRDETPELTVAFNENLERLAAVQGWSFVDAAAGVRKDDRYAPGMTIDGVHPTAAAARIIGEEIRAALLAS